MKHLPDLAHEEGIEVEELKEATSTMNVEGNIYVMFCYFMLCYVMCCYIMFALSCHVMSCYVVRSTGNNYYIQIVPSL